LAPQASLHQMNFDVRIDPPEHREFIRGLWIRSEDKQDVRRFQAPSAKSAA
jgi:hypothetical protein